MNSVPLWAFLAASIGGPVLGAMAALLGSLLNNRYAARRHDADLAFERERLATDFMHQRRIKIFEERHKLLVRMNALLHEIVTAHLTRGHGVDAARLAQKIEQKYPQFTLYCSFETSDLFNKVMKQVRLFDNTKTPTEQAKHMDAAERYLRQFARSVTKDLDADTEFNAKNLEYVFTSDLLLDRPSLKAKVESILREHGVGTREGR